MKKQFLQFAAACGLALHVLHAPALAAGPKEFSFAVITPPHKSAANRHALREAIEQTDADDLAFVVANGIKAADEPCTDKVYNDRKALLDSSRVSVIVSLTAGDWAKCAGRNGKSSAIGKLNRVRDLFFADEFSAKAGGIAVIRQSAIAKFRSYAENARWKVGTIMFATINLPSNNNHYVSDAGRNSEFEDRLIANRDWLHRAYSYAMRQKLAGIVLFCDGNPLSEPKYKPGGHDGFMEMRRYINSLSAKFPGKILLIHSQEETTTAGSPDIAWQGKLGELAVGPGTTKLTVSPASPALFTVANETVQASNRRQ